jgi:hypothetical protein
MRNYLPKITPATSKTSLTISKIFGCFVENFSLTPGFSRVLKTLTKKNRLNGFFFFASSAHRVSTRC